MTGTEQLARAFLELLERPELASLVHDDPEAAFDLLGIDDPGDREAIRTHAELLMAEVAGFAADPAAVVACYLPVALDAAPATASRLATAVRERWGVTLPVI